MAGVKGRSGGPRANAGGARPGAGRPKKEPAVNPYADPLDFLQAVWTGAVEATVAQVRAATAAMPFKHKKLGASDKPGSDKPEGDAPPSRFATRKGPGAATKH